MRKGFKNILTWPKKLCYICAHELKLIFGDAGVVIFFVLVSMAYPIIYSLVYNTEIPRDIRVVVVDDDRSESSREFVRALDATPEVAVVGYCANMAEARRAINEHECYGIINFPRDYGKSIGRLEQAHINVYCDMGVMMRYKQILMATTAVQQEMSAHITAAKAAVVPISLGGGGIENEQIPLGNVAMGLASAILPCILMLALQQSMLLGVGMLHGGMRDRRRRNGGIDPLYQPAFAPLAVLGRAVAHLIVYAVPTVYALLLVPKFFSFPQNGNMYDILALTVPFLLACSLFSQTVKVFVKGREATFITLVFTSIIFVFLTGISWPRMSMSPFWIAIGNMIPTTWGCNAYIAIQSNGASLAAQSHAYLMLWALCGIYLISASVVEHFIAKHQSAPHKAR